MSAIAFLRELIDAGLELEAALIAAERFERKALDVVEAKRAKDRDRKRTTRNSEDSTDSTDIADSTEGADTPLSLPPSPQTPQPPTHTPGDVTTRTRAADTVDFGRFWAAYPNKAGKDPARKAFDRAVKRCGVEAMLAAIERQRTWEQWQRGFVPHAATWLNNGRWQDEPPPTPVISPNTGRPNVPGPDAKQSANEANHARAFAGAEVASRWRADR